MLLVRSSLLTVLSLALLTTPLGLADDPPAVHYWVGSGAARVHVDGPLEQPISVRADVAGLCTDVQPLIEGEIYVDPNDPTSPPWGPTRDGVRETGVGGACVPFADDAGQTLVVYFQELVTTSTTLRALVCVDVDGDGACGGNGDRLDLCRLSTTVPISVWNGGLCSIYADPAAADPTVYVLPLASVTTDASGLVESRGLAGYVYVYRAA